MSFYDDASLIMFPSGYKEDKIYSLKPTDGSGDLTFTRASTATRVNSDGLIETSPVNLATNSENFSSWTLAAVTVTANDITAPNGTLTADKLTISSNGNDVKQTISVMPNSVYTWTFYVYGGTATGQQMRFYDNTNSTNIEYYIYSSSVVLGAWVKIERTFTTPSGCYEIQAWVLAATSTIGTMWVWGAQLNIGATAKPYFPTTDRLNVPRIDYTGGNCGKLLLESQRTNLVTYSESFDNAAWNKIQISATANNTTSPDGTQNADLITTTGTGVCYTYELIGTNGAYSTSVYAKNGNNNYFALNIQNSLNQWVTAVFDLSDGSLGEYAQGSGGSIVYVSHTITSVGNGWYRCVLNYTTNQNSYCCLMFAPLKTGNSFNSAYGEAQSNANNKTLYLYGAQLEAGSYVSSYVPTLASSVTRLADAAYKTGISSLIGQTEGVIFLDFIASAQNADGVAFSAITIFGNATDNFQIYTIGTALYWYSRDSSGVLIDESANQTLVAGQRYKMAYAYKSGDWALYINGVQKRTNTAAAVPAVSQFNLNATSYGASVATVKNDFSQALLFPTRLTNTQLATLTTI